MKGYLYWKYKKLCQWWPVLKCRDLLNRWVLNHRDHCSMRVINFDFIDGTSLECIKKSIGNMNHLRLVITCLSHANSRGSKRNLQWANKVNWKVEHIHVLSSAVLGNTIYYSYSLPSAILMCVVIAVLIFSGEAYGKDVENAAMFTSFLWTETNNTSPHCPDTCKCMCTTPQCTVLIYVSAHVLHITTLS